MRAPGVLSDEREPRRDVPSVAPRRRTVRLPEWPLALVLLGVATGLAVVAADSFRAGTVVIGCSVVLAMVLRAVLSERRAGLLAVRSKVVDVLTLGVLGCALTVLALVVPTPGEVRADGVGGPRPVTPALPSSALAPPLG
jgi:hypothetical protein